MDSHTTSSDLQRLEIVETGRRRRFSVELKRRIVEESFASGDPVSAVARRRELMPARLCAVPHAARRGAFGVWRGSLGEETGSFVAARIVADAGPPRVADGGGRMEIVSANGRRVIVGPDVDTAALLRVLHAVEGR
jgi:transposase